MKDLVAIVLTVLFYPTAFLVLVASISWQSRWFKLLEAFPDRQDKPILRLRGQNGKIGANRLIGVLELDVCPTGLRVRRMWPADLYWKAFRTVGRHHNHQAVAVPIGCPAPVRAPRDRTATCLKSPCQSIGRRCKPALAREPQLGQPRRRRPVLFRKRSGRQVMDDAAIVTRHATSCIGSIFRI
jgi:hypothetical protein